MTKSRPSFRIRLLIVKNSIQKAMKRESKLDEYPDRERDKVETRRGKQVEHGLRAAWLK